MLQRAERFAHHPGKDRDKASLLEPWVQDQAHVPAENRETYRWLLEEYRVSLFAQELGTAQPVSPKRLEALF
jgi:ATP-dependent helicase HrpA